jgi:carbamoyltransferase
MIILGVHGGTTIHQHDPAAALIIDGKLICCVEEERLLRVKTATGVLPIYSISACLKEAGIDIRDVDLVTLPGETYDDIQERTKEWLIHHFGYAPAIEAVNHQTAHLASAFYQSGYESAMCLSYDAYGDGISGALGTASSRDGIQVIETLSGDNSLGVFYATMTSFLGFKPGEDEYKVMGLAPYGNPAIDLSFFCRPAEGGYISDASYFRTRKSATQYEPFYSEKLTAKIGNPRRKGESVTQFHMDVAASTQRALEESAVSLVEHLYKLTGQNSLCLAGGVALNCSLNRILAKLPYIENFFVQPSASDRGLALGCALYAAAQHGDKIEPIKHVFYGPTYDYASIEDAISLSGFTAKKLNDPAATAAELLAEGKIIAWCQGRSEYGPRALGHRSILADPGIPDMKDQINMRVKFREEFRPFAPSVLEEEYQTLYDLAAPSPYMTIACDVKDSWGQKVPATTHINNTARVQTVNKETDPLYHSLIDNFFKRTGRPVVLNTSFNIRGQPIVETPLEAISTYAGTGIDAVIIGPYLLSK